MPWSAGDRAGSLLYPFLLYFGAEFFTPAADSEFRTFHPDKFRGAADGLTAHFTLHNAHDKIVAKL